MQLNQASQAGGRFRQRLWAFVGVLLALASSHAAELDWNNPTSLFTNFATRLLQSELGVTYGRIQIWPTNEYTPEVHRLLQVSVNLVEVTTNRTEFGEPALPTVFVPQFTNDGGTIFIMGYEESLDARQIFLPWRDLRSASDRAALQQSDNIMGIPWVIGARKGLPNFNEFSLQTVIEVSRRLQLTRSRIGGPIMATNQQFVLSISHNIGIELWNSYTSNLARAVTIIIPATRLTSVLTNEVGSVLRSDVVNLPFTYRSISANTWRGYSAGATDASFLIPAMTNRTLVNKQAVRSGPPAALVATNLFEPGFPTPKLFLTVSADVQCLIADSATGRMIDCVNLAGLGGSFEIMSSVFGGYNIEGQTSLPGSMWISNRVTGTALDAYPPIGVIQQLEVSKGNTPSSDNDWRNYSENPFAGSDRYKAIDRFRVFMGERAAFQSQYPNEPLDIIQGNVALAPYSPKRKLVQTLSWQANDPLVHYTVSDLTDLTRGSSPELVSPPNFDFFTNNLGRLNTRYSPWGGNPLRSQDASAFNNTVKDPLVRRSDKWDFPQSQPLDLRQIGRIHRGTPWQTIYLKSADVGLNAWMLWTGNTVVRTNGNNFVREAELSRPVNDPALVSILASLLNTNDPLQRLSINNHSTNDWQATLNGLTVISNSSPDSALPMINASPQFEPINVEGSSQVAANIVGAITQRRAALPSGVFRDIGDVLAVPELSDASPWLNRGSFVQLRYGISDAAYEALPSQLLPLLRPDPIGIATLEGGQLKLRFSGFTGYPLALEASPNMQQWTAIQTNTATAAGTEFSPPDAAERQFFRARLVAP